MSNVTDEVFRQMLLHLDRPASYEALKVMQEHSIDISQHKAQHINAELVDWADTILVMKPEHKSYIMNRINNVDGKVHLLTEYVGEKGDVNDPIGRGIEDYRECVTQLLSLLVKLKEKMRE